MFKALIPVKFEICVWSERVGREVEVLEERKRLGSYLSKLTSALSLKFINGDWSSLDRFIKRDEEAVC